MSPGKIFYLAEALRVHSVGDVATAIENQGCYGDDRFGRFRPLGEQEKANILDVLAQLHEHYLEWLNVPPHPDPFVDYSPIDERCDCPNWSDPLWCYGWPPDARPEFTSSSSAIADAQSGKPLTPRAETTYLNIIGALLEFVRTPREGRDSDTAVIAELEENYGEKQGIKKSTLQQKFAAAKRSLKSE